MSDITEHSESLISPDNTLSNDTARSRKVKSRVLVEQGKSEKPRLTLKQAAFVQYYTDPKSPTFGNKTQSYRRAYPNIKYCTASVNSTALTRTNTKVSSWIDDILTKNGATITARVNDLSALAFNKGQVRKVKRQVLDKEGEIVTLVDELEPTASERIKAHQLIAKIAGDTDTQRHLNNIAETEYRQLLKHHFKGRDLARDVTPTEMVAVPSEDGRADDGGEGLGGAGV